MRFYLGTHEPTWLNSSPVPLFVSYLRLRTRCRTKLPRAAVPWALDSAGYSVLTQSGRYPWTAAEYAADVRRYQERIGRLEWAAVMDWMCEDQALAATGLTLAEHQARTVESWRELRAIAPDLPWVPVLQGITRDDYFRCMELYAAAGTDLRALPLVGIGSVCRREDTREAERIIRELSAAGLRLHGFGFKLGGITRCRDVLASADSLAWSFGARKRQRAMRHLARTPDLFPVERRVVGPNDLETALAWHAKVLARAA